MGLVEQAPIFFIEMEHNTNVRSLCFGVFKTKIYVWLRQTSNLLAFIINIIFLAKGERIIL